MKKSFFVPLIIIVWFLVSCKSGKEKNNERAISALKMYLDENAKKARAVIDSFIVYKVTPLNELKDSTFAYNGLSDAFEYLISIGKSNLKKLKYNNQMLDAFSGYGDVGIWKDGRIESIENGKEIYDVAKEISTRLKKIESLDSLHRLDTTQQTGYIVHYKVLGALDGKAFERDSLYKALNNNFRIVDRAYDIFEYYKTLADKIE